MNTRNAKQRPAPSDLPDTPEGRLEWIKYQLRLRGSSLSAIAREQGVSRQAARTALIRPYPRMERAIAGKLGVEPRLLWPDRYAADGKRTIRPGRPPQNTVVKDTRKCASGNRRRQEAA